MRQEIGKAGVIRNSATGRGAIIAAVFRAGGVIEVSESYALAAGGKTPQIAIVTD
ncbi:MAG: hypothetical protein HC900_08385 [Methylacidiphilales bacterium]|nr:hypothetical protein [Candidatus Methylacidiphilales bacterium]